LVRGELDWIVMKALEKDRNRRYETANSFSLDVQRYLAGEPVLAVPPSAGYRVRKFARKHRAALTTAAVFVLLLVAGVAVSSWQAVRATQAETQARQAAAEALLAQRAEAERAVSEEKAKKEALLAVEAEKKAKQAEADRAAGEEKAKREAQAAVMAEKAALAEAQKRLEQLKKTNEIIASIFADLNIRRMKEGTEPLEAVLAKRLVKAAEQLEGEAVGNPLVVAHLQNRLGVTLLGLGHAAEAIPLFVKARQTRKAELGADHPDTLRCMNNLAGAYVEVGRVDLALPLLEETLKLTKDKLGADHPDTLRCMGNLADGYRAAGKLDLALPLLEENLKRKQVNLGPDDPGTLSSMGNLAVGYQAAGKLDLALPLYEENLKLTKAKFGPYHADTLKCMNNLAVAYQAAGKLDLALPLLEETLSLKKANLGAAHPNTLMSMNNLALGYYAAGKLDLALPLFEDTLKLAKDKLGAEHPITLGTMGNLASAYQKAGKLDQALPLFEETLRLQKAKVGADHPDTLLTRNNLAVCYKDIGKLDLALPLLKEAAMALEKRRYQDEHARGIVANLIFCYEQLKQFDAAEAWRRKWLAVVKERSGGDSVPYAGELAALGLNLFQQKKWSDAEIVLRDCLAIREKKQPDAWYTFNTQSMLGGALLNQKKYADAESLLLKGYDGMKQRADKIPEPVRKLRLGEAMERLAQLYEATGNKEEAAKWQKELKAIQESK
jgi:hypothetical protein